jgi:hypothetical protein
MKKLVLTIFGLAILISAHVATAAPTSTPVQNLFITGLAGHGTVCLHILNSGLVQVTNADCGTGGGGASTTINGVTSSTFTIIAGDGVTSTQSGATTTLILNLGAGCSGNNFAQTISPTGTFTCATPSGGASSTIVTGTNGVTVVQVGINATASLDTSYAPTWTGLNIFRGGATFNSTTTFNSSTILHSNIFLKDENGNLLIGGNGTNLLLRPETSNNQVQIQNFAGTQNNLSILDNGTVLVFGAFNASGSITQNGVQVLTAAPATTTINGVLGQTFTFSLASSSNAFSITTSSGALTINLPNNVTAFANDAGYIKAAPATTTIAASGTTLTGPAFTFASTTTIVPFASGTGLYWNFVNAAGYITTSSVVSVNGSVGIVTITSSSLSVATNTLSLVNGSGYITTSTITIGGVSSNTFNMGTGLTISASGTIGFTTTSISQFKNDSGYLANGSTTGIYPILWSTTSSISLSNIIATTTCTNCNLTVSANGLVTVATNGSAGGGGGGLASSTPWTANYVPLIVDGNNLKSSWLYQAANGIQIATGTGLQSWPVETANASLFALGSTTIKNANVSGTYIGINASSGFGGDFINLQNNSTTKFIVHADGSVSSTNITNSGVTSALVLASNVGLQSGYAGASACAAGTAVTTISAVGATTCAAMGTVNPDILANTVAGNFTYWKTSASSTIMATSSLSFVATSTIISTGNINTAGLNVSGTSQFWNTLTFTAATGTTATSTFGVNGAQFNNVTSTTGLFTGAVLIGGALNGSSTATFASTTTIGTGAVPAFAVSSTNFKAYVGAGSSTFDAPAAIGGTIAWSATSTGNGAGASTSIATYTIPTSTFGVLGDELDIFAGGTFANTAATNKQVTVVVSSTAVFDTGNTSIPANAAINWFLETRCMMRTATSSICSTQWTDSATTTSTDESGNAGNATALMSFNTSTVITIFGNGTNASDVVANYFRVMWNPAP